MRVRCFPRLPALLSLSAAVVLAGTTPGTAQSSKTAGDAKGTSAEKGSDQKERASGVILKVQAVKPGVTEGSTIQKEAKAGRERAATHRLTINTNAVWRDWARDQSRAKDPGSPKKDAASGQDSIATTGEPADANSLVVVDVGPETRVETRFRAEDDETSKGSKTEESARGRGNRADDKSAAGKSVQFRAGDLRPGLFVEVEFRHVTAQNPASTVTVIRPIGGPDSGAADRPK